MGTNATLPATAGAPAIEAHALARFVRMSPQKVRLVVDLIRGQRAEAGPANAALYQEARGA